MPLVKVVYHKFTDICRDQPMHQAI